MCVYQCVFYSMLGNFLMLLNWSFFLLLEIWIVFWFQFCDFQKTVLRNAFLQFFLLALWISSSLVSPSHAMATVFDCGSGMQTRLRRSIFIICLRSVTKSAGPSLLPCRGRCLLENIPVHCSVSRHLAYFFFSLFL